MLNDSRIEQTALRVSQSDRKEMNSQLNGQDLSRKKGNSLKI